MQGSYCSTVPLVFCCFLTFPTQNPWRNLHSSRRTAGAGGLNAACVRCRRCTCGTATSGGRPGRSPRRCTLSAPRPCRSDARIRQCFTPLTLLFLLLNNNARAVWRRQVREAAPTVLGAFCRWSPGARCSAKSSSARRIRRWWTGSGLTPQGGPSPRPTASGSQTGGEPLHRCCFSSLLPRKSGRASRTVARSASRRHRHQNILCQLHAQQTRCSVEAPMPPACLQHHMCSHMLCCGSSQRLSQRRETSRKHPCMDHGGSRTAC